MKKIIFILISLLLTTSLFPQAKNDAMRDKAAEPFLDSLALLFSAGQAYQIEFRYEVESVLEENKVEDFGSVIIKGQKYKLKTDEGDVYFNGTKMWTHNLANQEVYVSTPDPQNMDQLLTVPFTMLTSYKKYFKYKLKDEIKINNKIFNEVELYPVNLESSYSILKVQIEKSSGRLYSFTLQQKNGIIFRIFITEIITNLKISDEVFSWNKEQNPEVLVIEL